MQLTKSFYLEEFLDSQTAARYSFNEQFEPPAEVVSNLRLLCEEVLQPLRDQLKVPIKITSGYRCPRLNAAIGGASKSQHLTGHAADIVCYKLGNKALFDAIIQSGLPFDQIIDEFSLRWVHVSYDASRHRGQVLKAVKDDQHRTVYKKVNG